MIYIYDILLNFNNDFYEFFEWEKNDNVLHIKKIPIFKVKTDLILDILNKKVQIDDFWMTSFLDKCEVFEFKKIKTIKYACLLTDSYRVIGVLLNDLGNVVKVSDLLLDEALDAIDISTRCELRKITYNIVGTKRNYSFLTRNEIKIRKYLLNEIKNAYKEKDTKKLEYLYFEFFNKNLADLDKIYTDFYESLNGIITLEHRKLYELLKLSNQKSKLSNLTN